MGLDLTDIEVKRLWCIYCDTPLNENKQLKNNWFIFKKGTDESEILSWFDCAYSKGLMDLMYEAYYEEEAKWKSMKSSQDWNTVFWYIKAAAQLTKQNVLNGIKNWKNSKKN